MANVKLTVIDTVLLPKPGTKENETHEKGAKIEVPEDVAKRLIDLGVAEK